MNRNNLQLLSELVRSDFKLRYQNSWLGYIWTFIKPLLLFGVIYLVFSVFMKSPVEQYAIYLLLGIIIWNFFAEATLIGMNTFLTKRDIVTKINFPREILVIASTIASLITFSFNFLVFLVLLLVSGVAIGPEAFFFLLYIIELYAIGTGVTFILSAFYVSFRDLQHIWEVLLQIGFWLTPIIYPLTIIPEEHHRWVFLNPLARIIEYSRDIFIRHHIPSLWLNLILLFMSIGILGFGYLIFKRKAAVIAEKI